jgi:hypothetical protein
LLVRGAFGRQTICGNLTQPFAPDAFVISDQPAHQSRCDVTATTTLRQDARILAIQIDHAA